MKPNYIPADLDDILFENRERRYGAFPLRKNYPQLLMGVTAIVLGCVLSLGFVVNGNLLMPEEKCNYHSTTCYFGDPFDRKEDPDRYISLNLMSLDQKGKVPPRPQKKEPFLIPQPVQKEKVEDGTREAKKITFPNIDVADLKIGFEEGIIDYVECGCDGREFATFPEYLSEKTYPEINEFISVDEEPQAVNLDQIRRQIGYPPNTMDACIEGAVVVRMLVDRCGVYQKHTVIKKVHPILSDAVEKHIHKLKFTPAIQGGRPIAFWVNVPFRFQLL